MAAVAAAATEDEAWTEPGPPADDLLESPGVLSRLSRLMTAADLDAAADADIDGPPPRATSELEEPESDDGADDDASEPEPEPETEPETEPAVAVDADEWKVHTFPELPPAIDSSAILHEALSNVQDPAARQVCVLLIQQLESVTTRLDLMEKRRIRVTGVLEGTADDGGVESLPDDDADAETMDTQPQRIPKFASLM